MECKFVKKLWQEMGEQMKMMELNTLKWEEILVGLDGKSEKHNYVHQPFNYSHKIYDIQCGI